MKCSTDADDTLVGLKRKMAQVNPVALSEEQTAEFKEVFVVFDKDNDGKISGRELAAVMRSLDQNVSDAELKEMMELVGKDVNGYAYLG